MAIANLLCGISIKLLTNLGLAWVFPCILVQVIQLEILTTQAGRPLYRCNPAHGSGQARRSTYPKLWPGNEWSVCFFLEISLISMKSCPVTQIQKLCEIADQSWFGMRLPSHIGASDPSRNGHQPPATLENWNLTSSLILLFSMHVFDQQKVLDTWPQQAEHIILGLEYRSL